MDDLSVKGTSRRSFLALSAMALPAFSLAETEPHNEAEPFVVSALQVNGAAVSRTGEVVVSLPRWVDTNTISLAVRDAKGRLAPWPGGPWNTWQKGTEPTSRFVCVNAVHIDPTMPDSVWAVDAAAPAFGPVVPAGPKLVQLSLAGQRVVRSYPFGPDAVPTKGYLNDVRFAQGHAFLTESGTGAILVLNLQTGQIRRLLADHPSTKAVPGKIPIVDSRKLSTPSGGAPKINCDGIELSLDRQFLLYAVPFGGWLWRVPIARLLDERLTASELGNSVERLGPLMPIGGMTLAPDGGLLLSDVEHHSIVHRSPDGSQKVLDTSALLQWPDASTLDHAGNLLVAASQVNHMPAFNGGLNSLSRPFHIVKVPLPASLDGGPQA